MTHGIFWIDHSGDDTMGFLAVASDDIIQEPQAEAFDELIGCLYEGEKFWYMDAHDAYGILESSDARHTVSLFNHERVLLTFAVDAEWVEQTLDSGGFGLIVTYGIAPEAACELSKEQLVKARDEDKLGLILVGIRPPSDNDVTYT